MCEKRYRHENGSPASCPHHRVLETLRERGLRVAKVTDSFGEARNRLIARAKIVLNIHAWDGLPHLETVRLSFLLSNQVFVLSEQSDHNPYGNGLIYAEYPVFGRPLPGILRSSA